MATETQVYPCRRNIFYGREPDVPVCPYKIEWEMYNLKLDFNTPVDRLIQNNLRTVLVSTLCQHCELNPLLEK